MSCMLLLLHRLLRWVPHSLWIRERFLKMLCRFRDIISDRHPIFYSNFFTILYLERKYAEVFDDLSTHLVKPFASQRVVSVYVSKMNRIKPVAVNVDKSSEIHHVVFNSTHLLRSDQVTEHFYFFTWIICNFTCRNVL